MSLSELLFDAPHSLARQSWAPQDMRGGGTINADGFGVGWYTEPGAAAIRYRKATPLWSDVNLRAISGTVWSGAVLAATRSATAGMPIVDTASAPFTDGHWLFSLNGKILGWPDTAAALAAEVPVTDLLTIDAPTDSALLWVIIRNRLATGLKPEAVLADVIAEVDAAAPGSRLNLLLTNGEILVGTTWTHSLSVRQNLVSVTIASEPLDDRSGWVSVPDKHIVIADKSTVDILPL